MNIRKLSLSAIFFAILILIGIMPIRFALVKITILPVFIVFTIIALGIWGVLISSLSFWISTTLGALIFGDPSGFLFYVDLTLISRIVWILIIYLLTKIIKRKTYWVFMFLSILATLLNSISFTAFLFLHQYIWGSVGNWVNQSLYIWVTLIWVNVVVEIIVAAALATPLFIFYKYQLERKEKEKLLLY